MIFDMTGNPDQEMTIEEFKQLLLKVGAEEELPSEPISEPEPIVPDDIVSLFSENIPESIPVEGWTLEVPMGEICFSDYKHPGRKELFLTPELQEWCDDNLQAPYWFLGEGYSSAANGLWDYSQRTAMLFFTLEMDYILFKMRWS
jgi:hypothetical protein